MRKIKRLLFLVPVLAICLAGCGRTAKGTEEAGELVRAGETAPGFFAVRGIKLDRQRRNWYNRSIGFFERFKTKL